MGDIAKYVLTTDDLLKLIVSFHTNDFIVFFEKDRLDLFGIRNVSKKDLDKYIDERKNKAEYRKDIAGIELKLNRRRIKENKSYYFLKYISSGTGHDGYCSDNENYPYEPFYFYAIVRVENKSYKLENFNSGHFRCNYKTLNKEYGDEGSRYCGGYNPKSKHKCRHNTIMS